MRKMIPLVLGIVLVTILLLYFTRDVEEEQIPPSIHGNADYMEPITQDGVTTKAKPDAFSLDELPPYTGEISVVVHGNVPYFAPKETAPYVTYHPLDRLGRVTGAEGIIDASMIPKKPRGSIATVYPTGWKQKKYPSIDNGGWIYNRCHLIGHQITGEDANDKNLMTGTRAFNVDGMLPYENIVADYVRYKGPVAYRVTPYFVGKDMVARGVLMEAKSIGNDDVQFCVFVYNVQPGIRINYRTGDTSHE